MYDWYKIFNLNEFTALNLVSKSYTQELEDLGEKTVLVVKAINTSIIYEGVQLTINLNDENPFAFDGYAVYKDTDNNVYLGIELPDET